MARRKGCKRGRRKANGQCPSKADAKRRSKRKGKRARARKGQRRGAKSFNTRTQHGGKRARRRSGYKLTAGRARYLKALRDCGELKSGRSAFRACVREELAIPSYAGIRRRRRRR